MGDIAEQTVAGAISTGTHGSGGRVASLSAQVRGLELVTGTGELLRATADEHPDVLDVARLGLGALGILTTVTLAVEPLLLLRAHERPVSWDEAMGSLDELVATHDHVDAYWFPHTDRMQVKTNDRLDVPVEQAEPLPRWRAWLDDDLLANRLFDRLVRLGRRVAGAPSRRSTGSPPGRSPSAATPTSRTGSSPPRATSASARWSTPSPARPGWPRCARLRRAVEASDWRIGFPVEVRFVPADDVPLSPAYGRDVTYLAVHTPVAVDHHAYFAGVEPILRDHGGRPHWGKLHTLERRGAGRRLHPRFADVVAMRDRLDPDRVFGNAHLRRVLGG